MGRDDGYRRWRGVVRQRVLENPYFDIFLPWIGLYVPFVIILSTLPDQQVPFGRTKGQVGQTCNFLASQASTDCELTEVPGGEDLAIQHQVSLQVCVSPSERSLFTFDVRR